MADSAIGALPAAGALAVADLVEVVQGGAGKQTTVGAIRTLILGDRYIIRADVDRTLPNDANLNALFNNPTNGRLTLGTGLYIFRGLLLFTAMSGTSGNLLFNLLGAGTAVIASPLLRTSGIDNTAPATLLDDDVAVYQALASAAAVVTAVTGTALRLAIEGAFEVTTGGTLIPSIDLANAAAAVLQDGSYLVVDRLGDTGLVSVGPWD